jgi:putative FmdB family regulatory protein
VEDPSVPTYQYACTECDHAFEQFQSFSEDSLTTCPECQGRLRKVFNAVGVVFKGSGFYRTDSRADSRAANGSSGNGSSGNGSSDSAAKSTSGSDGAKSGGSDSGKAAASTPKATSGATAGAA